MENPIIRIAAAGIYDSHWAHKGQAISQTREVTMFEIDVPHEEGGISYLNEHSTSITPGLIVFGKPGDLRHTKFPFSCYYVHMNVCDATLRELLCKAPSFLHTVRYDVYIEIIRKLRRHLLSAQAIDEIHVQSLALELTAQLLSDAERMTKRSPQNRELSDRIEQATLYIRENLCADLSLDTLSARFGFSATYFHKAFKIATSSTLHDYVEEQRIHKAMELIPSTTKSLAQIAYECGFSSQSYFSYAFRRRLHMTPREYVRYISICYEHP